MQYQNVDKTPLVMPLLTMTYTNDIDSNNHIFFWFIVKNEPLQI